MAKPNYTPGLGGLATNRYDFESHIEGFAFRHNAIQIDVNPAVYIAGTPYITVADALNAIGAYITFDELTGQGFVAVGDGYDTYVDADGNPNYNSAIPSLDTLLNPIFSLLLAYYNNPSATTLANIPIPYLRVKDGGIILIKAGTYTISNTVTVPPGFILMGEGFGTKLINQIFPAAPMFSVLPDNSLLNGNRQVDFGAISGSSSPDANSVFMFSRENGFVNMVIGDNFVEPIQSGTQRNAPQNTPVISNILNATNTNPIEITTTTAHGLLTGSLVTIDNVSGNIGANGTFIATVIDSTHFTVVPTQATGVGSGGAVYAVPAPLISQKEGSSISLENVKFVGKTTYSGNLPSQTTGAAIATDSTTPYTTGTYLYINNCQFDGFAIPISFTASGNIQDRLHCSNSKIRSIGSSTTNNYGTNFQVGPIQMSTCNAEIHNNEIFIHDINNSIYFSSLSSVNPTSPSVVNVATSTFESFNISNVTNTSPIQITTTIPNNLVNGTSVTISGVGGNTAANGIFPITVINSSTFSLNGTSGNGAYSSGGTVYVGDKKMNISIIGNNITSDLTTGLPATALNIINYIPYTIGGNLSNQSVLASAINLVTSGNVNNVSNNVLSPVAYTVTNTGSEPFYSFTGNEVLILVPNSQMGSPPPAFPINLPKASSVPGRIITIKNISAPGVAFTSPTTIVPWGPSLTVANTSGLGVPITVYTTLPHNLLTGASVTIIGVNGNTNANGKFTITATGSNSFTLNSITGNGTYTGGGIVYATDFIEGNQLPYSMMGDYQIVRLISDATNNWWFI